MTQRPKLDLQTLLLAAILGAQGSGFIWQGKGTGELGDDADRLLTKVVKQVEAFDGLVTFLKYRVEALEREQGDLERRVRTLEKR